MGGIEHHAHNRLCKRRLGRSSLQDGSFFRYPSSLCVVRWRIKLYANVKICMKVAVCPPFSFIFGLAEKGVPSESTNHLARHYNHLFVDSKNLLMRMQKGSVRFPKLRWCSSCFSMLRGIMMGKKENKHCEKTLQSSLGVCLGQMVGLHERRLHYENRWCLRKCELWYAEFSAFAAISPSLAVPDSTVNLLDTQKASHNLSCHWRNPIESNPAVMALPLTTKSIGNK